MIGIETRTTASAGAARIGVAATDAVEGGALFAALVASAPELPASETPPAITIPTAAVPEELPSARANAISALLASVADAGVIAVRPAPALSLPPEQSPEVATTDQGAYVIELPVRFGGGKLPLPILGNQPATPFIGDQEASEDTPAVKQPAVDGPVVAGAPIVAQNQPAPIAVPVQPVALGGAEPAPVAAGPDKPVRPGKTQVRAATSGSPPQPAVAATHDGAVKTSGESKPSGIARGAAAVRALSVKHAPVAAQASTPGAKPATPAIAAAAEPIASNFPTNATAPEQPSLLADRRFAPKLKPALPATGPFSLGGAAPRPPVVNGSPPVPPRPVFENMPAPIAPAGPSTTRPLTSRMPTTSASVVASVQATAEPLPTPIVANMPAAAAPVSVQPAPTLPPPTVSNSPVVVDEPGAVLPLPTPIVANMPSAVTPVGSEPVAVASPLPTPIASNMPGVIRVAAPTVVPGAAQMIIADPMQAETANMVQPLATAEVAESETQTPVRQGGFVATPVDRLAAQPPIARLFTAAPREIAPTQVGETTPEVATAIDAAPVTSVVQPAATAAPLAASQAAPLTPLAATGPASAPAPVPADLHIERQLDVARDSEWLDKLTGDIVRSSTADGKLSFRLAPEHLGRLQVEIAQAQNGASVRMTTESETARALLADAQPRLIAEARAQGVRIAESHVDLNSGGGQPTFGEQRRQSESRPEPFARSMPRAPAQADENDTSDTERFA